MTNNRSIDETIVRIRPDKAAAREVERTIKQLDRSADSAGKGFRKAFDTGLAASAKKARTEVERLNTELRQSTQIANERFDTVSRDVGLAGDVQSNLGAVSALSGSGEIAVAGEVVALVEELPRLKTALVGFPATIGSAVQALGPGGVVVATVAAGVAIIAGLQKRAADEARTAAEAAFAAQKDYFSLLRTGTSDSIDQQLEQIRLQKQIAQDQATFSRSVVDGLEQAIDAGGVLNRAAAEVASRAGTGTVELAAARQAAQDAQAEVLNLSAQEAALTAARSSSAIAANDAEQAERDLADARAARDAEREQFSRKALSIELDIFRQSQTLTEKQASAQTDLINAELDYIQARLESGQLNAAQVEDLTAREDELLVRRRALIQATLDIIRPREAETALMDQAREAIQNVLNPLTNLSQGIKDFGANVEKIKAAREAITKVEAASAARLDQIAAQRTETERRAQQTRNNAIADAEQDASNARADLQLDREEAEREHQQNINRIVRRANATIAGAIQSRNAVAAAAAIDQRDLDLEAERENASNREKELNRQSREIDRSLRQQTRTIKRRYTQQLQTASIAAEQAIRLEGQRAQAEISQRTQALQALLQIEAVSENQRRSIAVQSASARLQLEGQFWQASLNLARDAVQSIANAQGRPLGTGVPPPIPTTIGRGAPVFHNGGVVTRTGLAMVQRGEVITNPNRGQSSGSVVFNISGMSRRQILREVERQLDDFERGYANA